jgi:DNA polymerase
MERSILLKEIKEEIINFQESPFYKERVENGLFPVIGEGSHSASVMFVGEAPGANEAKTGRPFCGSAGKILDFCLFEIKLNREDVYITNIVKDRPPLNRDPSLEEIKSYAPFLDRQINIIQPKIIVTLGRFSANYILEKFNLEKEIQPISILNGRVFNALTEYGEIKIIPLIHPAAVIYQQSKKELLLRGFFTLKRILSEVEK